MVAVPSALYKRRGVGRFSHSHLRRWHATAWSVSLVFSICREFSKCTFLRDRSKYSLRLSTEKPNFAGVSSQEIDQIEFLRIFSRVTGTTVKFKLIREREDRTQRKIKEVLSSLQISRVIKAYSQRKKVNYRASKYYLLLPSSSKDTERYRGKSTIIETKKKSLRCEDTWGNDPFTREAWSKTQLSTKRSKTSIVEKAVHFWQTNERE